MKINFRRINGYVYGALQHSVALTIDTSETFSAVERDILERLFAQVRDATDGSDLPSPAGDEDGYGKLSCVIDYLNRYSGDQRFTDIRRVDSAQSVTFYIPTISAGLVLNSIEGLFKRFKQADTPPADLHLDEIAQACKASGRKNLPAGTNAANFISVAARRHVPFRILSSRHIIFGYGASSRIFDSSLAEDESTVGTNMSKSKSLTNQLLNMAGFPVAQQVSVNNLKHALRVAQEIGYPVVLKPNSEDQGRGVYASIGNASELETCFREAAEKYSNFLIEKHVDGDVYRIVAFKDRIIRTVYRPAPTLTGDGTHTLRELIDLENQKPERNRVGSSLQRIKINQDLARMAAKQGLTLDGVPHKDQIVRLSSGLAGSQSREMDTPLHPDNIKLCTDVAKTMRLSLAGVDLISKDPSVPWHENNAIICEVNAQPQLGSTDPSVYVKFLTAYLQKVPEIHVYVSNTVSRTLAPIYNKSLHSLDVRISPESIRTHGLPCQYYTSLSFGEDVTSQDRDAIAELVQSRAPNDRFEPIAPSDA